MDSELEALLFVGCILGKGGSTIEAVRSETGAHIRVIRHEQAPPIAEENDDLVMISGQTMSVRAALMSVCSRLVINSGVKSLGSPAAAAAAAAASFSRCRLIRRRADTPQVDTSGSSFVLPWKYIRGGIPQTTACICIKSFDKDDTEIPCLFGTIAFTSFKRLQD